MTRSASRSPLSRSDEWETPQDVFEQLCYAYGIKCEMDVACTDENCKTKYRLPNVSALDIDWVNCYKSDVWCNPPHSLTGKFVKKAHEQWQKHNINILMIIPANSICTKYSEKYIKDSAEYHPIYFRPKFLHDGKPSKDPARNSYFVVIWRARG